MIGSFVWDVIHRRDRPGVPVEEWGGITYSLAGFDAALPPDWEIVPIIKVGSDLALRAREHLRTLRRIASDATLIEVPHPTNRVELRYVTDERRTETLTGGVPGWEWAGLKTALDTARVDALYVNFVAGWELDLETMQLLRGWFPGPIYCDFHMKVHSVEPSGLRVPRPVSHVREWCASCDYLQVNEDELAMMAPDPMALAATALHEGTRALFVTLGSRGAVYFTAPEGGAAPVRTALLPAVPVAGPVDPTGCGDVWGSTCFARLVSGASLTVAMAAAQGAAARNAQHRGASGLASHLRGELSLT